MFHSLSTPTIDLVKNLEEQQSNTMCRAYLDLNAELQKYLRNNQENLSTNWIFDIRIIDIFDEKMVL